MKRFRKQIHKGAALLLAVTCMIPAGTGISFGAVTQAVEPSDSGKSQAELNGYTDAQWAALCDDVLEYSEIQGLVHCFNPSISAAWETYDDAKRGLQNSVNELKWAKNTMKDLLDKSMETGDFLGILQYGTQTMILEMGVKSMEPSIDKLSRPVSSSNSALRQGEASLVYAVRCLFLSYRSLLAQKETLNQLVTLYQQSYEAYVSMAAVGMATGADVMKAQNDLASAQSQLLALQPVEYNLYNQLITLCGWKAGSAPVIGGIPQPDLAAVDRMDPENDLAQAASNNSSVTSLRHEGSKGGSIEKEGRNMTVEQMENNILMHLKSDKADALAKREAYYAAQTGYQSALLSKNAADTQYSLGMLTKAQYTGILISYVQKKGALDAAACDLVMAIETYQSALEGNCSVE